MSFGNSQIQSVGGGGMMGPQPTPPEPQPSTDSAFSPVNINLKNANEYDLFVYDGVELSPATTNATIAYQGFVNSSQTALWIAPPTVTNPTISSQGIYTQYRLSGDMGDVTHDAVASEIRLTGITDSNFLNAQECSWNLTGGANTITDGRALTANANLSAGATGTITTLSLIRAQQIGSKDAGLTVDNLYSLYIESQTVGARNISLYVKAGDSVFGSAALNVNATTGFVYIPTCAGSPTGVPVGSAGTVPMIYDTTDNNFYIYNGSWKKVTLA